MIRAAVRVGGSLWRVDALRSAEEKHVRGAAAATAGVRAASSGAARQRGQLATSTRVDASEVDVRVDGTEHGA